MSGSTYHTAERMGWSRWTRKHKRKFKKRFFKQHGVRFGWMVTEFRVAFRPYTNTPPPYILFQRNPTVGLGATVKPG